MGNRPVSSTQVNRQGMRGTVGRVHRSTGAFEECEQFLDPMAQWQTGEWKLTRQHTHIVAGGGRRERLR